MSANKETGCDSCNNGLTHYKRKVWSNRRRSHSNAENITLCRIAGKFGGDLFWQIANFESNPPIFHPQKHHSVMSSWLHSLCTRRASLIVGMDFTIESCERGHRFSKKFCTAKDKSWLVCQREEGDPNDVHTAAVKTDGTKTVQIKHNNKLSSFQLHFIIDLVLTEWKLDHGRLNSQRVRLTILLWILLWLRLAQPPK